MSRFLKIEGNNSEEKFKHLEVILKRFSRRLHKTIVTVVPPSPMFFYTDKPDEDGMILKCVIPASGEIVRACLVISRFLDKGIVPFDIEIAKYDIFGVSPSRAGVSFQTRKNVTVEKINLPVDTGDCLTFSTSEPDKIIGIWTTILYVIDPGEGKVDEVLIDNLDKLIEENFNEGV